MPRSKSTPEGRGAGDAVDPVFVLADVLLQRAALVARVARDRSPDPLAGLKVDDDDVVKLLAELPGLEGQEPEAAADIDRLAGPDVLAATAAFEASLEGGSPLATLAGNARLSNEEAAVLAVLYAVEVDPRRQRLVGYLNDDVTQKRPTAWTLTQLWGRDDPHVLAVSPASVLRRAALLEAPAGGPWSTTPVALAPSVVWWLSGSRFADQELPPAAELVAGANRSGGGEPVAVAAGEPIVALSASPDRVRRRQAVTRALGEPPCIVTSLPTRSEEWDALVRQATLDGAAVVLEVDGTLTPDARSRIDGTPHLGWGLVSPEELPLFSLPRRPWVTAAADHPLATAEEWEAVFGPGVRPTHRLGADQLRLAGAAFASTGDLDAAVRRLAAGHISGTAQRIRPRRGWEDLVLDETRAEQVREIALRCRHRERVFGGWGFAPEPSTGVVALFAGQSGTGKTLAAEVIAAEVGVDLYKIDLSNLVSKYIGETEKNLAQVFDAAEASNVALFFDEADALFGKRSSVSDAHDRYANIEVAYLLQRLERYEGLAVMATNLVNNIDPAFVRRFHVVVEFPMPGPDERRRIWGRSIPAGAPVSDDLDLDALAKAFELSGGTIRNAVLGAAFLAAEADSDITMATAVLALRREMEKSGRLVTAADFGHLDGLG